MVSMRFCRTEWRSDVFWLSSMWLNRPNAIYPSPQTSTGGPWFCPDIISGANSLFSILNVCWTSYEVFSKQKARSKPPIFNFLIADSTEPFYFLFGLFCEVDKVMLILSKPRSRWMIRVWWSFFNVFAIWCKSIKTSSSSNRWFSSSFKTRSARVILILFSTMKVFPSLSLK